MEQMKIAYEKSAVVCDPLRDRWDRSEIQSNFIVDGHSKIQLNLETTLVPKKYIGSKKFFTKSWRNNQILKTLKMNGPIIYLT